MCSACQFLWYILPPWPISSSQPDATEVQCQKKRTKYKKTCTVGYREPLWLILAHLHLCQEMQDGQECLRALVETDLSIKQRRKWTWTERVQKADRLCELERTGPVGGRAENVGKWSLSLGHEKIICG